jgi:glycosyltransferase involved in cell wall biosynthesis
MRIVIATPFYPPQMGILATYAVGLEEAFKQLGHDVHIVLPDTSLPSGIRHVEYFFRMLIKLGGASFVLSLDTWSVGIPAFFAARLRRVPFLIRIGGDHLWEQYLERTHQPVRLSEFYVHARPFSPKEKLIRYLTERMLGSAHAVMFNTRFQKDIWERAYHALDASVLENFYPEKKTFAPPSNHVFVSAHRGAWYKNIEVANASFARVKARQPDIELDTKEVPHSGQLGRLASSYAVIIPSISEIGSNLTIEAVSVGRPFIMTEDTGTKERLGECGLFIDTRSEEAMAKAIELLLDPAVYAKFSAAVTSFSFTRSWKDIAKEILAKV